MIRTVYFLTPRRDSNDFEWEKCQSQAHLNIRMKQEAEDTKKPGTKKPRTKIGISVTFEELGKPYQFPILVPWLRPRQAIIDTNPEPGDTLIALLELKSTPDFATLQTCTLEQALALCETYDSGDFTPV